MPRRRRRRRNPPYRTVVHNSEYGDAYEWLVYDEPNSAAAEYSQPVASGWADTIREAHHKADIATRNLGHRAKKRRPNPGGIPRVREWIVTADGPSGRYKYRVLAPTKMLAKLNFRHHVGFHDIISIGRPRTEKNQRQMVTREDYQGGRSNPRSARKSRSAARWRKKAKGWNRHWEQMSTDELIDELERAWSSYGEIRAENANEVALYGDSGPGSAKIQSSFYGHIKKLEREIDRRGGRPRVVRRDTPSADWRDDIPF